MSNNMSQVFQKLDSELNRKDPEFGDEVMLNRIEIPNLLEALKDHVRNHSHAPWDCHVLVTTYRLLHERKWPEDLSTEYLEGLFSGMSISAVMAGKFCEDLGVMAKMLDVGAITDTCVAYCNAIALIYNEKVNGVPRDEIFKLAEECYLAKQKGSKVESGEDKDIAELDSVISQINNS